MISSRLTARRLPPALDVFHSKSSETPKPLVGTTHCPLKDLLGPNAFESVVASNVAVDRCPSPIKILDLRRPSGLPQDKIRIKVTIREHPCPPPELAYQFAPPSGYYYMAPPSSYYYSMAPPLSARGYRAYPPPPSLGPQQPPSSPRSRPHPRHPAQAPCATCHHRRQQDHLCYPGHHSHQQPLLRPRGPRLLEEAPRPWSLLPPSFPCRRHLPDRPSPPARTPPPVATCPDAAGAPGSARGRGEEKSKKKKRGRKEK